MKDKNNNLLELGDYVYYVNANCDTIPTQIQKVGKAKVRITDLDGKLKWVNPASCEIQDDQDGELVGKWNYVPSGATTTTLKEIKQNFFSMNATPVFILKKNVHKFVGVGYVEERQATKEDYLKYPIVIS